MKPFPRYTSFNQFKHKLGWFYANNDMEDLRKNILRKAYAKKRLKMKKVIPNLTVEEMQHVINETMKSKRLTQEQRKSLQHIPGILTTYQSDVCLFICFIPLLFIYAIFLLGCIDIENS